MGEEEGKGTAAGGGGQSEPLAWGGPRKGRMPCPERITVMRTSRTRGQATAPSRRRRRGMRGS